jgi:dipeptidyl aminopeptidase/acylaminoacyl peptidase
MSPTRRLTLIGLFSLAWPTLLAAAPPRPFQLEDLRRLVDLSEVAISPDGQRVAVVVATPDWKKDEKQEEIDLVDAATGIRRALTWKRTGLGSPTWSPDGSWLAFLADDLIPDSEAEPAEPGPTAAPEEGPKEEKKEKQAQVFVMSMAGGDPIRVTAAKHGVEAFSWSPDGQQIAYVTADEPANAKAIAQHDDAFQVTDNHFLTRAALTPAHLWLMPAAGGTPKRLTQGALSLQTDQQDAAPVPAWSPDGQRIAFTRFPGPYWGPSFHSVIDGVGPGGGEPFLLVSSEGAARPAYAPGGGTLAYLRPRGGDQNNGFAVYVLEGGAGRDATADLARNFHRFAWLPGGRSLLLEGYHGTASALWEQPLAGKARELDLGDVLPSAEMSVARSGAVAFVGSTATHPDELYLLDSLTGKPRRLTDFNAFVDELTLGRPEPIAWQGPNGMPEDGVLTYPVGYQPGTRYPLVLVIHGGPESASTVRFSPLPQLLSAAGFLVFQPNYRGSTNLGDAYQHAIYRDTGAGPGEDVMAGLAAVEKLGIVDPDRIGVSGWSYGGYMTTWLTGHYSRWKAAVAGAALTDWVMDYTVAYYQQGDLYFFGGSPWTAEYHDIWRQQSPIAYADRVTAPTLIMGDVGDPNVPLLNSYEWYHALRDHGVEVEFWAYPVDHHFPKDIVRRTDVYRRWVGWLEGHLK